MSDVESSASRWAKVFFDCHRPCNRYRTDESIKLNTRSIIHIKCNDTHINDLPTDVLARIITPHCTLDDRIQLIRTCKLIRNTIMHKRMSIYEKVTIKHKAVLSTMPALVSHVVVQHLHQWEIINSDRKQRDNIQTLELCYDVINDLHVIDEMRNAI
jgi:hypothetical protein